MDLKHNVGGVDKLARIVVGAALLGINTCKSSDE